MPSLLSERDGPDGGDSDTRESNSSPGFVPTLATAKPLTQHLAPAWHLVVLDINRASIEKHPVNDPMRTRLYGR